MGSHKQSTRGRGAEALLGRPVAPPPVILESPLPKIDGLSTREQWAFEIVDASAIPREYLMPDEKKIGQVVRALKGQANIPGVKAFPERIVASRVVEMLRTIQKDVTGEMDVLRGINPRDEGVRRCGGGV